MMRYIAILILSICVLPLQAQTFVPSDSLDKPIPAGWWKTMSIEIHSPNDNVYAGISVYNILTELYAMGHSGSFWDRQWTHGDYNAFKSDMADFIGNFSASSEVYNMTLSAGNRSFLSLYGDQFTPPVDSTTGNYDVTNYTDLANPTTSSYTWDGETIPRIEFYAGRNTAVEGDVPGVTSVTQAYSDFTHYQQLTVVTNGHQYNIWAYGTTTPLVLDMDGDGKLEASQGEWLPHGLTKNGKLVDFDINGDGFDELVEWVGANDGVLLVYNKNEKVNGSNMFGTIGVQFTNGYEKLSTLDKNKDNKLEGEELKSLSVWQDRNGNAIVDAGEVTSVQELGITQMQTTHNNLVSSFVQNGKTKTMWDWNPVTIMAKKKK